MKIKVTKEDIRLGSSKICDGTKCPIARAMKRAGIKIGHVGVTFYRLENQSLRRQLPTHVTRFICDICDGEKVKPFIFELKNAKR